MPAVLHERLADVVIEGPPYAGLLVRYDQAAARLYLDPPYWNSEDYYGPVWSRDEFGRLAEALRRLKGWWLLSINDVAEIRPLFAWARIEVIEAIWSTGGNVRGRIGDLVIQPA